ncbi:hypothetical protein BJX70DRAFT_366267 [Aspergillus crustosus]
MRACVPESLKGDRLSLGCNFVEPPANTAPDVARPGTGGTGLSLSLLLSLLSLGAVCLRNCSCSSAASTAWRCLLVSVEAGPASDRVLGPSKSCQ